MSDWVTWPAITTASAEDQNSAQTFGGFITLGGCIIVDSYLLSAEKGIGAVVSTLLEAEILLVGKLKKTPVNDGVNTGQPEWKNKIFFGFWHNLFFTYSPWDRVTDRMLQETMKLSEWFWDEEVWLPPNVTWSHLQSTSDAKYFEFADLGRRSTTHSRQPFVFLGFLG